MHWHHHHHEWHEDEGDDRRHHERHIEHLRFWGGPGRHNILKRKAMKFGPRRMPFGGPPFPPFGGPPFGGPGGPGGPPDPFDEGGRPQRKRRGDIKFALLELLAERPRHGYELIKDLEERSGGFYRPSPGSVYPTLQLLEDEGHVVSEMVDGKKVYSVTESGKRQLQEWQARRNGEGDHRRGGGHDQRAELHALRESSMSLMASVMTLGRHGTPEQVKEATTKLDALRRELYGMLATDAPDEETADE